MEKDSSKIKLQNVKVIFYTGPEDPKSAEFGTSVTVDVTDPTIRNQLVKFCKENNVGKKSDPNRGKANIKEYTNQESGETTYQYTIKFNDKTAFGGLNGLGQKDIAYGSVISVIANTYDYTKFGGGTAMSASAIIVSKPGASSNDDDLKDLLEDVASDTTDEGLDVVPF